MDEFKVIEIKKSVFENNDREADRIRERLKKDSTSQMEGCGESEKT